jgi:hypothetical protein
MPHSRDFSPYHIDFYNPNVTNQDSLSLNKLQLSTVTKGCIAENQPVCTNCTAMHHKIQLKGKQGMTWFRDNTHMIT